MDGDDRVRPGGHPAEKKRAERVGGRDTISATDLNSYTYERLATISI
jgi:hypothetical protein